MRYKYYTDNKTIVIAISSYAGKPVKGIAKCSPEDEFDLDKGKALARLRCDLKIAEKRVNRAYDKHLEAKKAYFAANRHLDDMHEYLNSSKAEYLEISEELKDIINEL